MEGGLGLTPGEQYGGLWKPLEKTGRLANGGLRLLKE